MPGAFRVVVGLVNAVVCNNVHRRLPTQVAHRRPANERNAFICDDAVRLLAHEGAVDALDRQRWVIMAIGNLVIFAVLDLRSDFHVNQTSLYESKEVGEASNVENVTDFVV